MTFRLLTYNIKHGGGGRLDAIAAVVNSCAADLVLLQEASDPANVERLAAATGMADWKSFSRQSLTYSAGEKWHSHSGFGRGSRGTRSSRSCRRRSAACVWCPSERRACGLDGISPCARAPRAPTQRGSPPGGIPRAGRRLNTVAPNELLQIDRLPLRLRSLVWLSGGRIRWRTIQTVLGAGYVDAYRGQHPETPGWTLPSDNPHIRLDYVFVPQPRR